MFKTIFALTLVGFMAACTGATLPTAPVATLPTAPTTEIAQVKQACETIAANEAAIQSWVVLADTYGSLFGQDFGGKIEKLKAENKQYQEFLKTKDVICAPVETA